MTYFDRLCTLVAGVFSIAVISAPAWTAESVPLAGIEPGKPRVSDFAAAPTAKTVASGVEISFEVKSEIDVAVEIVNKEGKVLRHLAAGVLGANPPEPLVPGLSQKLVWDCRDDKGVSLPAGSYSVRVALGLKPEFERIIGWSGQNYGGCAGLTVDKDGTLYMAHTGPEGHHTPPLVLISSYDAEGKYLRQVMPFPANLPRDKVVSAMPIAVGEKGWMPVIYHALVHTMYPYVVGMNRTGIAITPDGKLLLASNDGVNTILLRVGKDGSAGSDFVGPTIQGGAEGYVHLACSPDNKYIYASGLKGLKHWDVKNLHQVVYRVPATGAGQFEVYLGEKLKSGAEGGLLSDPRGMAFDKDGNLYVCEYGNNRVSVFAPDKKLLGTIPCPSPDQVAVDPRSGKVYMLSSPSTVPTESDGFKTSAAWWTKKQLIKVSGWKSPKQEATIEVPDGKLASGRMLIALDAHAEPNSLWVGNWSYGTSIQYKKVIDRGDKFEIGGEPLKKSGEDSAGSGQWPKTISIDREHEVLDLNCVRFDGNTGKMLNGTPYDKYSKTIGRPGFGEEILSPDGTFILNRSGFGQVSRLLPDGTGFKNFLSGSAFVEPGTEGAEPKGVTLHGGWMYPRGIGIGPDNQIYVVHGQDHFRNRHRTAVSRVSADGKITDYQLITVDGAAAAVRADRKGNIYIGVNLKPAEEGQPHQDGNENVDAYTPRFFRGKVPKMGGVYGNPSFWSEVTTGSIVKFPPTGGKVLIDEKDGNLLIGSDKGGDIGWIMKSRLEGAKWMAYGVSPMPYKGAAASGGGCVCESARFDLDGHDRLFIPEALRFSVSVLDANGNFICRFGEYGNMDSRGPGSPVPEPAIAFGWPMAVAASDHACYVGDNINARVVKAKLAYQVEKQLEVHVSGSVKGSK